MPLLRRIPYFCSFLYLLNTPVHADTMEHYMNISHNIPQMEMKADSQSQMWAKSARNILTLTSESIAESLTLANQAATRAGSPLFCLPDNLTLDADQMNKLIMNTFLGISSQQSDKNKMTVSQVALLGLMQKYPCKGEH